MQIEAKVKEIISSQLNISADKVTNQAKLADDLGADSLDTVEVIMALEEEFGHETTTENMGIITVQDIINYILTEENKKQSGNIA